MNITTQMNNTTQLNVTTQATTLFNFTLCFMTSLRGNSSDNNTLLDDATLRECEKYFSFFQRQFRQHPVFDYPEYKVGKWLSRYRKYIMMALGYPGNLAAIITVSRMKPFTTVSVFMVTLAVMDTMALVCRAIFYLLTFHQIRLYDFGCQFMKFIVFWSLHYANWVLVLMTAERFIAVAFPMKIQKISTKRRVIILLVIVAVILAGINAHLFETVYERHNILRGYTCTVKPKHAAFYLIDWYWIENSVFAFVPCTVVLILNVLIIVFLRISAKKQKDLTQVDQKKSSQQKQITVMLLTVSITFVILTMSNTIFTLYYIYIGYYIHRQDPYDIAVVYLTVQIMHMLGSLNNATNFYFYFLSGKKFRRHFIRMICCCYKKQMFGETTATTETSVVSKATRH